MNALLDWLLPCTCLACSAPLAGATGSHGRIGLCLRCEERLVLVARHPACALCAEAIAAGRLCALCALEPPPWRRLHALFVYAPPLREVLHALKFRRLDYLGRPLGERLGRFIRENPASLSLTEHPPATFGSPGLFDFRDRRDRPGSRVPPDPSDLQDLPDLPDLVIPMPLAWPRRLARGFNQAESLAHAVAGELGRPHCRALRRRTALSHQTGKSRRERLRREYFGRPASTIESGAGEALRDAFQALPYRPVARRRLLLVDDVLTTGATARGAAAVLLAAGARSVDLAVVARTPRTPISGGPAGADGSIDTP